MIDISDRKQVKDAKDDLWYGDDPMRGTENVYFLLFGLVIEGVNANVPIFSRIFKEMIIFTAPNKPLPHAGKGTVMRKASLTLYEEEIKLLGAFPLPA